MRDSQQSKVFTAETTVRGPVLTKGELETAGTRIVRSAWFNKRLNRWKNDKAPPLRMLAIRNQQTSCYQSVQGNGVLLTLHPQHHTTIDMLHGLAHILTREAFNANEIALHGPEFCKQMLDLCARWVSPEAKRELQEAFRAHRVKHRVYSPEAREAARIRGQARFAREDLLRLRDEFAPSPDDMGGSTR